VNYIDKLLIKIAAETRPTFRGKTVHVDTIKTALAKFTKIAGYNIDAVIAALPKDDQAAIAKLLETVNPETYAEAKKALSELTGNNEKEIANKAGAIIAGMFGILGADKTFAVRDILEKNKDAVKAALSNNKVQATATTPAPAAAPAASQTTSNFNSWFDNPRKPYPPIPLLPGVDASPAKGPKSLAEQGYYKAPPLPDPIDLSRPEYRGKSQEEVAKIEADIRAKADQAKAVEGMKAQADAAYVRGNTKALNDLAAQNPEVLQHIRNRFMEADTRVQAQKGNIPAGAVARNQKGQFFDGQGNMLGIKDGKTVVIGKAPPNEGYVGIDSKTGKHNSNFQQRNPDYAPMAMNRALMDTADVMHVGAQAGLDPNKTNYKFVADPDQIELAAQLRQKAAALDTDIANINKMLRSSTDPKEIAQLTVRLRAASSEARGYRRQADQVSGSQDHYMSMVKMYGKAEADKRMDPKFYADREARIAAQTEHQEAQKPGPTAARNAASNALYLASQNRVAAPAPAQTMPQPIADAEYNPGMFTGAAKLKAQKPKPVVPSATVTPTPATTVKLLTQPQVNDVYGIKPPAPKPAPAPAPKPTPLGEQKIVPTFELKGIPNQPPAAKPPTPTPTPAATPAPAAIKPIKLDIPKPVVPDATPAPKPAPAAVVTKPTTTPEPVAQPKPVTTPQPVAQPKPEPVATTPTPVAQSTPAASNGAPTQTEVSISNLKDRISRTPSTDKNGRARLVAQLAQLEKKKEEEAARK
jgi:hypothetical protein